MKDMGMEKIIFGKDNVLCFDGETHYLDPHIFTQFENVIELFGEQNVIVLNRKGNFIRRKIIRLFIIV